MAEKTNIEAIHRLAFDCVTDHGHGHALFSCFYDGVPAVAIVAVQQERGSDENVLIAPVWLYITPEIARKLRDHDGTPAAPCETEAS